MTITPLPWQAGHFPLDGVDFRFLADISCGRFFVGQDFKHAD
jgi:hypothetical protein